MQGDSNAKQQAVERIKNATNILVTVSSNPSVDELSAALGLTLMLNKMDKHGTAVFSGNIPPAIQFLEPGKTFENTVDSLRDFIIALDKEKADRLRYKVEDDVVKVFITPYRTTITEKDLQFSQGDYNVELIIALGVEEREDLDKAIVAHGRILHDATIVTINASKDNNKLGSVDWQDDQASSLCEMLMSLSEALQPNLLDEQMANALLTGIVAATDRFRNENTKPRVMTMAAQLMAAGANQQLIATKLEEGAVIPSQQNPEKPQRSDGSTELAEGKSSSVKNGPPPQKPDGEMVVEHKTGTGQAQNEQQAEETLQKQLDQKLPPVQPGAPSSGPPPDLGKQLQEEAGGQPPAQPSGSAGQQGGGEGASGLRPPSENRDRPSWMGKRIEPPSMGGTLNATSQQALNQKLQEEADKRNHTLLSHDAGAPQREATPSAKPEPGTPAAPPPPAAPEPPQAPAEPTPTAQGEPAGPPTQPAPTPEQPAPSQPPPPSEPTIPHQVEDMAYEEAPVETGSQTQGKTLADLEAEAKAHAADVATQASQSQPTPPSDAPQPTQANTASNPAVDEARQAAMNAYEAAPFDAAHNPAASAGAQPFPPVQHDAAPEAPLPAQQPQIQQHNAPMLPPEEPPMPDFSTLPPPPPGENGATGQQPPQQQPQQPPQQPQPPQPTQPPAPPANTPPPSASGQSGGNNLGQFKIPGQQ